MKKSILIGIFICVVSFSFAQGDKYETAMKAGISQLNSLIQKNNFEDLPTVL